MKLPLGLFIVLLWVMLLAISGFLVLVVAPLEAIAGGSPRIFVSVIQATIAISAVILFVLTLSRMKRFYVNSKIRPD